MTIVTSPLFSRELWSLSRPSPREEKVCPCGPEKEKAIAMVTLLPSSVESCGGGHGLCHRLLDGHLLPFLSTELWRSWAYLLEKRRSAFPIPKKKRMTMATLLSSILDACQDQGPPAACRQRRRREKLGQGGHGLRHHLLDGHLLPFLSRKLWRWSWHIF